MPANHADAPLCEIDGLRIGFRGHDGTVTTPCATCR